MNISIDYTSKISIYEQIVNEIERYVLLGIYSNGEQISSIRDLSCQLGINPNTVKKSYSILEKKGVIRMDSTRGTFISDNIDSVRQNKIDSIYDSIDKSIDELINLGQDKNTILKNIGKCK